MKLSTRYITGLVGLVVIACVMVAGAVVVSNLSHANSILQEHGIVTAQLLAELTEDDPALNLAKATTGNSPVTGAALYNSNFDLIASHQVPDAWVPLPSIDELRTLANLNATTGGPAAAVKGNSLTALADVDLTEIKYAVIQMDTAVALRNLGDAVQFAILATLVCAALAGVMAFLIARRITRPMEALGQATFDLEAGHFHPETLAKASRRGDELGALARRFTEMAQEVQQREQQLASELQALQVQIDQGERQRTVATITGSESFADLEQRAVALRERRAHQEQVGGNDAD
ncbi:MAG: HAMP domain-containing protein [Candidatus Nanopelagicales bacterium]|nr:HAMP domain-containing protein [Candidatus Nanopelagicales bacterium]